MSLYHQAAYPGMDQINCTAGAGKWNWPGKQLLASHQIVSEHMLESMKALGQSLIQDVKIVSRKSSSDVWSEEPLYIAYNKSTVVMSYVQELQLFGTPNFKPQINISLINWHLTHAY